MNSNSLFYIIIAILIVQFIVDFVLDFLNAKRFKETVPDELNDVFDKEAYDKSQEYKSTNYRFGILNDTLSLLLTLGFLFFGGFEWLDALVRSFTTEPIMMALIFFGILALGSSIISIPFSFYQTFSIEERFGFNKTTKRIFFLDIIKGWLVTAVLGGGVLALVIWILQWSGPYFWLYAWALFIGLMVFILKEM